MLAPLRSRAKTFVTKARRLIAADDLGAAREAVDEAVVSLAKAARGFTPEMIAAVSKLLPRAKVAGWITDTPKVMEMLERSQA